MEWKEILPYIIAVITSICSWIGSYLMSSKKAKQDLNTLKIANIHDLEKLMNQHKLDIIALEEKHKQQLEIIEKEHLYKLELIQREHENELIRKEKELEDTAKYGLMKDVAGGIFSSAMNNQQIQEEAKKIIAQSFLKKDTT